MNRQTEKYRNFRQKCCCNINVCNDDQQEHFCYLNQTCSCVRCSPISQQITKPTPSHEECCSLICAPCSCLPEKKQPKKQAAGIQAKLLSPENFYLNPDQVVIFDKVLNHIGRGIFYDQQTGAFMLAQAGNYVINWSVTVEGSDESPFVKFGLLVNGTIKDFDTIPVSVGQITGSTLITVTNTPAKVALINHTGDIIQFSRYAPCANLTIHQV